MGGSITRELIVAIGNGVCIKGRQQEYSKVKIKIGGGKMVQPILLLL